MTQNTFPSTIQMAAQDVARKIGSVVVLPDGRTRTVRDAKFACCTITLLYLEGPSDTYRRTCMLDVLTEPGPCANCGTDLTDHDRDDLRACQTQHLAHLAGQL